MADIVENRCGPLLNLPINLFKEKDNKNLKENNPSKKFTKIKQTIKDYNTGKLSLDELRDAYEKADYETQNMMDFIVCYSNSWGSCYSSIIDFIETPFKDSSIIDISKVSFKNYNDSIKYWDKVPYSSINNVWKKKGRETFYAKELLRPYAIKLRINAFSLEDTDKIWKCIYPILNKHRHEIVYRLPKDRGTFVKNMEGCEIGKFLTIYTIDNEQAIYLLKELDSVLSNSSLKVFPFSSLTDIAVGGSGVLSAVYDKDYYTISDKQGNKANRRDLFLDLYNLLKKEGLIYGLSLGQNKIKMDTLKISDEFYANLVDYVFLKQAIHYGDYEEFVNIINKFNVDFSYNNYELMECAIKSGSFEIIDYLVRKGIPKELIIINELKLMVNKKFDDLCILNNLKNYSIDFEKVVDLLKIYNLDSFKSLIASQFIIYNLLEGNIYKAKEIYFRKDIDTSIVLETLSKRPTYKEYVNKFL